MFKVIDKLFVGNTYCVSIEGDIKSLQNGLNLTDEKGNTFQIISVAMSKYQNVKEYERYAELVLNGNVENIGETLFLKK